MSDQKPFIWAQGEEANVKEPIQALRENGWRYGDVPAASNFNWLFKMMTQEIASLRKELISHKEEFAEALKNSPSAFEKYCDDAVMENMKKAKYTAFGLGPIAAYIFARMTEIGCVRIILSAKFNGTSEETVRERMRELYV